MKKALLPVLIATALPLTALADVTVYGKANVSLQNADEAGDTKIELLSNASRIGVKGEESITDGLKAIYLFEYQTEVDDGNTSSNQTFSQRNIYVGLQGSAGTIMAGNFDTPLKVAQEKVDLFNDLEGDMAAVVSGEIRAKNIVQYVTPKSFGGFAAAVAYITKEEDGVDDGISASLGYTAETFYLGVAVDQDVIGEDVDVARAVARVNIGPIQLGALYEFVDVGEEDSDGFLASAMWSISDAWALKAQYGESDAKLGAGLDNETMSVGVDYKLSKSTTLYSYYTTVENDPELSPSLRDDDYVGIGIDHKF